MFFFKKNYKNKGCYFCYVFFCFNFLLIKNIISYLFDVYCRLTFDPRRKKNKQRLLLLKMGSFDVPNPHEP